MAEKNERQDVRSKYGIKREVYKKGKKGIFSGNKDGDEERPRFKWDAYYKITAAYTVLVAIIYCVLFSLRSNGYMLINTTIQYWLWFALVIGIILMVGRIISNLPKQPMARKSVKICVSIFSIIMIFMLYLNCISSIDNNWHKCATLTSEDGRNTILVMRMDVTIEGNADNETTVYTIYSAYPQINKWFCNPNATEEIIMLKDGQDQELKMEWGQDQLKLYVEDGALEEMDSILVPLD